MDPFINGYTRFRLCIGILVGKHLSIFLQSGVTLKYAFSRFCKNKLARAWKCKGNPYNFQTVSDKSS